MDRQAIATVIARCGEVVSAEYIVEFTSPGGFFEQQFACADQGLLQSYIWITLIVLATGAPFYFAFRVLHKRQAHNDVSALFFASFGFWGARVIFFLIHLMVYARNGMGLGMLLFLAQFLDFVATTLAAVVLVALVHGIYVTRPSVLPGSEERDVLIRVVGGFAVAFLVSTLACGFRLDAELTPFGLLRGFASWPYIVARIGLGVFCFKKGMAIVEDCSDAVVAEKRPLLTTFSFIAAAWLEALPVLMVFSSQDWWRHNMVLMEFGTIAMYGGLLYYFWPSRFGAVFSYVKPTERAHPYAEFGLPG